MRDMPLPGNEYLRQLQRLEADTDRVNSLIDELIEMGTQRFQISGGGEPFFHKNALEFMGRIKRAGCFCVVLTNGTLLDPATIDELIKMRFDELRITTMAGSREMYLKTHPGVAVKTFDNLRDNLIYLAERKKALGVRRPKVTLVDIVIAQNFDGLFEFAEFANFVRADRALFLPVDDIEDTGLAKLVLTKEQGASVRKQLSEVCLYLETQRIGHNINDFLKVFGEQRDTTLLYRVIPCYYGWFAVRIDTDGTVYPCCRCYDSFGNVYEKELHKIWYGETYRRFREEAVTLNRRKTPVSGCDCNSCSNYAANLHVYRLFHPVRGRSGELKRICPVVSEEG